MGSLADELAEAWDSEDEIEEVVPVPQGDSEEALCNGGLQQQTEEQPDYSHDTGSGTPSNSNPQPAAPGSLSPSKFVPRSKHRRQDSYYDGSDYGDDSHATGISPSLEARMATIESLARRGTESNGSEADSVIQRVADLLKDLSSQSGVENSASR